MARVTEAPIEASRERGAFRTGAQQNSLRRPGDVGPRLRPRRGSSARQKTVELLQACVERRLPRLVMEALERSRREREAAGRLADPEIDPPGCKILKDTEHLSDLEGTVVLQHDAAGANADAARGGE